MEDKWLSASAAIANKHAYAEPMIVRFVAHCAPQARYNYGQLIVAVDMSRCLDQIAAIKRDLDAAEAGITFLMCTSTMARERASFGWFWSKP